MRFLIDGLSAMKQQRPATAEQQTAGTEVRQIIESLRIAKSGDVTKAFALHLKNLHDHGEDIQKGIIAWVHLVEVLIQGAEQRYPNGNGPRKLEQVRTALHHIFADPKIDIPELPHFLEPVVMDIVVEWSINALVASVNQYELWDSSTPERSLRSTLKEVFVFLRGLLRPFGELLGRLYVKLRYSGPLTPEVAAAVQRVQAEGLIKDKRKLFRHGYDFVIFIGQHQPQVTAGVKVFFEVVAMAERWASASGPDKKAYARAIIRATLEELGFPIGGGLLGAIADAFIDAGIESALSLFKKRKPEAFFRLVKAGAYPRDWGGDGALNVAAGERRR